MLRPHYGPAVEALFFAQCPHAPRTSMTALLGANACEAAPHPIARNAAVPSASATQPQWWHAKTMRGEIGSPLALA
jgi:hypothetical protein